MTPKQKKWIDEADYETLLRKWRFGALGDSIFVGEAGEYYSEAMAKKKAECADPVAVSKIVGWDR